MAGNYEPSGQSTPATGWHRPPSSNGTPESLHHPSLAERAELPRVDHHRSIHLVIGPGGVLIIDSKQYRGRLQLDPSGRLWQGRYPLAPALRAVSFEADQAAQVLPDPGAAVVPVMAVQGALVPWGKVVMGGVPVVPAGRLPRMLGQLPAVLGPERVAGLADHAPDPLPRRRR